MRILIANLLRMGDVVMAAPALHALRRKEPDAEIHLLINRQCSQVAELMPWIDRVWHFDREAIQSGLGDASTPVFESYERVAVLVDELNGQNFDWSINLTQNRLSGWIMSAVQARSKLGLTFDDRGLAHFGSPWLRHLNSQIDADGRDTFHFTDFFRFAIDSPNAAVARALVETEAGRLEAEQWLTKSASQKPVVCVQALTSDEKKNYGFTALSDAITSFQTRHSDVQIALMGAPFEASQLSELKSKLLAKGVNAELAILSFAGAYSLLRRSRLLLTADTSIQHLGAQAEVPIVQLSLGSSDPFRTGAYAHGSVILASREPCAPCSHSSICHRESHVCGTRMPPEAVSLAMSEVYARRSFQLATIAEEFARDVSFYQVDLKTAGFWVACPVGEPFTEANVSRWINAFSRKIWLGSAEAGTEILRLSQLLRRIYPEVSEIEWRHIFDAFENQLISVESRLNGLRVELRELCAQFENPKRMSQYVRMLSALQERMKSHAVLSSFRDALEPVIDDAQTAPFTRMRRIVDAISEIDKRAAIMLKITRTLEREMPLAMEADR